jgi:hypothetical protein
MDTMVVVDCELSNGRGYVVLSDASEFEITMEDAGLHLRILYSDEEISNPAIHDAVRLHLVHEHLLGS